MMYKYILILIYFFLLAYQNVNALDKASIKEVNIIKSDYTKYDYDIIGLDNKIPLKYLLSDNILFEITGSNFLGYNIKGSLIVEIDDKIYESTIYYNNNSKDKIYFGTNEIRDLLLNSISKSFKFKFCPYSENEGCGSSKTIIIKEESQKYNDTYYNFQYYMKDMNIEKAKELVDNKYVPIIAIIDDGISSQHSDLVGTSWFNEKEINGNGIDDDNNGYIDDYYGWNFVDNNNIMFPKGDHGTGIAGIIGANTNNNIGVTGIVDNVKLMPIITCSSSGCTNDNINNSIKYAVNNGANIINLSLGGQWFVYDNNISDSIKYAVDNGVIIVIATGNGDKFLTGNGIDTSTYKISPVCNENESSDIIGVSALSLFSDKSKSGLRTSWSNYGNCSDIYAYGEYITLITKDDGYTINNGTSFSAPIITGIIGLGFNKYGKIDNKIIHKSLISSANKWHGIDAEKYIEELGKNIEESQENITKTENENKIENGKEVLKNKYKELFKKKLGDKLEKLSIKTLKKLLSQIDIYLKKYSNNEDLVGRLEALKEITQETISY